MHKDFRSITATSFGKALSRIEKPGGRVCDLLRHHLEAGGHVMTMIRLAQSVGYKSYSAVNLQYGLLAFSIAEELGIEAPRTRLFLTAEFVGPNKQSNEHWQIVLRPAFAKALSSSGWLD